jgi:hypothetical protein
MRRGMGDIPSNYGRAGSKAAGPYGTFDPYGDGGGLNRQYHANSVGGLGEFALNNKPLLVAAAVIAGLWFLGKK